MTCRGCQHYTPARLVSTNFDGRGWCYLPKVFPTGIIVNTEGECDQKERKNKVDRFIKSLKEKPKPTHMPCKPMQHATYEKWLSVWAEHQELRQTFKNFDEMKNFANSYGYRKKDVQALIRHKRVKEEMDRT